MLSLRTSGKAIWAVLLNEDGSIGEHKTMPTDNDEQKQGALDMLVKPFRDQELLDVVQRALARHEMRLQTEREMTALRARQASLTPREQEVMGLVAEGLMNKQIAARLGIAEVTVKMHRAAMLRKMSARTVVDLVRMVATLERGGP